MPEASISLLYEALGTPKGIEVRTSDPNALRQKLYTLRKKAEDPSLDILSFLPSPTDPSGHLWIVKRAKPDET